MKLEEVSIWRGNTESGKYQYSIESIPQAKESINLDRITKDEEN